MNAVTQYIVYVVIVCRVQHRVRCHTSQQVGIDTCRLVDHNVVGAWRTDQYQSGTRFHVVDTTQCQHVGITIKLTTYICFQALEVREINIL